MISLKYAKQFCKEYYLIENYQEAVNDQTQTWHCHHRRETDENLSRKELIAIGCYYDVHYSELIFLTPEEHKRLHMEGKEGYWKGKVGPMKGKPSPNKGKSRSEETKEKISNSLKGYKHSDEFKIKISDARKCRVGENAPNYKYHITAEELYDLYVVQDLSAYRIAKMYGCHSTTILYKLKKFNIKK